MRCPFCSTENDNERTTCIACGSPLQIPEPTVADKKDDSAPLKPDVKTEESSDAKPETEKS